MLIMNETQAALNIIKRQTVSNNTYADLILLIKYYSSQAKAQNKYLTKKELIATLQGYIKSQFDNYKSRDWYNRLEKLIKKYKNVPLYDIDSIPITKSELEVIKNIGNKKLEKIAFVSLVFAKFYNLRNINNNGYVNVNYSTIFSQARVAATVMYGQPLLLHDLKEIGLIKRATRIDNPNFRVLFIDDNSPVVLHITDLRELGYQYLRYKGEEFIECAECRMLLRKRSNNTKYCPNCRGYQPIQFKTLTCIDCGQEFVVSSKANYAKRCDQCKNKERKEHNKMMYRQRQIALDKQR